MGRPRFCRGIGGGEVTTCLGRPPFCGGSGWGGVITFLARPRFRFFLGSLVYTSVGVSHNVTYKIQVQCIVNALCWCDMTVVVDDCT